MIYFQAVRTLPVKSNAKNGFQKANVPKIGPSKNAQKLVGNVQTMMIFVKIPQKLKNAKSGKIKANVPKIGQQKNVQKHVTCVMVSRVDINTHTSQAGQAIAKCHKYRK